MKKLARVVGALLLTGLVLPDARAHDGHGAPGADANVARKAAPRLRSALGSGAAIAPDGALWLVGVDPAGRLFIQRSNDLGITWEAPRLLDIGADTVSADGENRPKVAFGPQRRVVIAYTQPLAKPNTGEIRLLRSADGGETFAAPLTIHRDRQLITHRFESLGFDRAGVLHAVWIDKRDLAAAIARAGASSGKTAGNAAGKSSTYAGAAIYRNESHDGGQSFGPDVKLADHSCECCRIALAPTPEGGLAALWRHVFAPNIRDHAFAILGAAPATPVRATEDEWRLDACPHHGPGLAAAAGGGYHAVWFGEKDGRAAVRYGRLAADGRPRGAARELPDPRAEHADVAAAGKLVAIAWRSYDGTRTQLKAWLSADDGATFSLRELAASGDENDYPRLLASGDGLRVLWRTAKEIHVLPLLP